MKVIPETHRSH